MFYISVETQNQSHMQTHLHTNTHAIMSTFICLTQTLNFHLSLHLVDKSSPLPVHKVVVFHFNFHVDCRRYPPFFSNLRAPPLSLSIKSLYIDLGTGQLPWTKTADI